MAPNTTSAKGDVRITTPLVTIDHKKFRTQVTFRTVSLQQVEVSTEEWDEFVDLILRFFRP